MYKLKKYFIQNAYIRIQNISMNKYVQLCVDWQDVQFRSLVVVLKAA